MTNRLQNCCIATISALLLASSADAAELSARAVKNIKAHVPSMGDGPGDWIQFKNGHGVKNARIAYAEMKNIVVGTTGRTPMAVSHVQWRYESGSGRWNTLILFKESKGKIAQTGIYPNYIGSTDKLEIKQNKIFVHLSDSEDYGGFPVSPGVKKEGKGWISLIPGAFTP